MSMPDLQLAFDVANLRELMREVRRLPDAGAAAVWRRADEIMTQAESERREETRIYHLNFAARVEAQKAAIRDEDKAPRRDFEPEGYGGAKFDERMVERQARHRVEFSHQDRLDRLTRDERDALQALRREARRLVRVHGTARKAFNRISPRRAQRRSLRRSWVEE